MYLKEITGFESYSPVIIIKHGGKIFYYKENLEQKRITFNLPTGNFEVHCEIERLKRPLRYEYPKLPPKEKKNGVAPQINITIGQNPNKASYTYKTGEMFLDEAIDNRDRCGKVFVMGHELGHSYYTTEWKCDVFSASQMLERGFNPSQCYYANAFCLSAKQGHRKDILFSFLEKVKCYE